MKIHHLINIILLFKRKKYRLSAGAAYSELQVLMNIKSVMAKI